MKKLMIVVYSGIGLLAPLYVHATAQEDFLRAHAWYAQGKYGPACAVYESLPANSSTLYNLGACYYQLGRYPQALVSWRRAQRTASWSQYQVIEQHIARVYRELGKTYTPGMLQQVIRTTRLIIPLLFLQLLVLLGMSAALYFFLRRSRWYFFFLGVALAGGAWWYLDDQDRQSQYAVVVAATVPIYAGPAADYPVIETLQKGDEVVVTDRENAWYKIGHIATQGWVKKDALAPV